MEIKSFGLGPKSVPYWIQPLWETFQSQNNIY